jgi:hypothetical protein
VSFIIRCWQNARIEKKKVSFLPLSCEKLALPTVGYKKVVLSLCIRMTPFHLAEQCRFYLVWVALSKYRT